MQSHAVLFIVRIIWGAATVRLLLGSLSIGWCKDRNKHETEKRETKRASHACGKIQHLGRHLNYMPGSRVAQ